MKEDEIGAGLKGTGERLIEGDFSDTTMEHLHRYALAALVTAGNDVLDIASGEGYGSNLLARTAKSVIGVDIADEAVQHARRKYQHPNLIFKLGSADRIPVDSDSIDVVVSFETVEHHAQHEAMLSEIRRVLRRDGLLIMSTPDKQFYSDVPQYRNPFHVKELHREEFRTLVSAHFANVELLLQKVSYGSLVIPEANSEGFVTYDGDFRDIQSQPGLPEAMYMICLASDASLPPSHASLFDGLQPLRSNMAGRLADNERELQGIRHSWSFRIGRAITWPARILRGR